LIKEENRNEARALYRWPKKLNEYLEEGSIKHEEDRNALIKLLNSDKKNFVKTLEK